MGLGEAGTGEMDEEVWGQALNLGGECMER